MDQVPELQRIFNQRTSSIYRFMVERVAVKRSGTRLPLGVCRFVPFTQAEFSAWVLDALGGRVDQAVQCAYCNAWLNVSSFVVDHRTPMGWPWLGSLELSNLALACASCNQRKGCMSDEGFTRLVQWATVSLDHRDVADMLNRMASAGMTRRLQAEDVTKKKTQGMRAQSPRSLPEDSLFARTA